MTKKILFILLILITIPNISSAMGISPPVLRTDFQPGETITFPLTIRSNFDVETKVGIEVIESSLSQFATLSESEIIIKPRQTQTIQVQVKLPQTSDLKGIQSIRFRAFQKLEEEAFIGVTTAVISRLEIKFPYPDRYAELNSLNIPAIGQGENFVANFNIENKGNQEIQYQVIGTIINDQEIIDTQSTQQRQINPGQTQPNILQFQTQNLKPGQYQLRLELKYDQQTTVTQRQIRIGEKTVSLINYPNTLRFDRISEFSLTVRNEWNEQIRNVRATLQIQDVTATTNQVNLQSHPQQQTIKGFFNTEGISIGEKQATITIDFEDLEGETFQVVEKRTITITDQTTTTTPKSSSENNAAVIILSVLLIIAIISTIIVAIKFKSKK